MPAYMTNLVMMLLMVRKHTIQCYQVCFEITVFYGVDYTCLAKDVSNVEVRLRDKSIQSVL